MLDKRSDIHTGEEHNAPIPGTDIPLEEGTQKLPE